jgi:hypothetical protein
MVMADGWRGEFPFVGDSARQIAVAENADGRLEIFYVGTNGDLYHNWQKTPNGILWAGETRFAQDSAKQVAAIRNQDGRLEIFYVGTNDALYHNWQTQPNSEVWAGETRFAQDSAKQIAVAQNQDGSLEIFYVGTNNALCHNRQTAPNSRTWSGETRFSNDSARQVAVAANKDGRLEIVYAGTDNHLYRNTQAAPNSKNWLGETRFANDSAIYVAAGQNSDGGLEIFYVGTNDALYHNWQTEPNGSGWAGEARMGQNSAKQIAVGRNTDGTLEIFYVGTNNGLYRNRQSAANSHTWIGETPFRDDLGKDMDSANQIAVGTNVDGRLEIFYVGTNETIYHNFQIGAQGTFGSNYNQILYSNSSGGTDTSHCGALTGVSVTIEITDTVVCAASSGPTKGFGFQLNAYSPTGEKSAWQQYTMSLFGNTVIGAVDNWPLTGDNIINDFFTMASLAGDSLPIGYVLKIVLANDDENNITGATYTVTDAAGKTIAEVTKNLLDINGGKADEIAPIIAFELNLVGPVNGESTILSSGAGKITYAANTSMTPLSSEPACAESGSVTGETANSVYSTMAATGQTLSQTFGLATIERLVVRKTGTIRPHSVLSSEALAKLVSGRGTNPKSPVVLGGRRGTAKA